MIDDVPVAQIIQKTIVPGVWISPATADLSSTDMELVANERRSFLLRDALRQRALDDFAFDFILIDCPPSLNLLTVNAMVAADSVLVPLQTEFFALEGLSQLMLTIREVRQTANPDLRIEGVLLTMYDGSATTCLNRSSVMSRDTLGDWCSRRWSHGMCAFRRRRRTRCRCCLTIPPPRAARRTALWRKTCCNAMAWQDISGKALHERQETREARTWSRTFGT